MINDQQYLKYYDELAVRLAIRFQGGIFSTGQIIETLHICCTSKETHKTIRAWVNVLENLYIQNKVIKCRGMRRFQHTEEYLNKIEDTLVEMQAEANGHES